MREISIFCSFFCKVSLKLIGFFSFHDMMFLQHWEWAALAWVRTSSLQAGEAEHKPDQEPLLRQHCPHVDTVCFTGLALKPITLEHVWHYSAALATLKVIIHHYEVIFVFFFCLFVAHNHRCWDLFFEVVSILNPFCYFHLHLCCFPTSSSRLPSSVLTLSLCRLAFLPSAWKPI